MGAEPQKQHITPKVNVSCLVGEKSSSKRKTALFLPRQNALSRGRKQNKLTPRDRSRQTSAKKLALWAMES